MQIGVAWIRWQALSVRRATLARSEVDSEGTVGRLRDHGRETHPWRGRCRVRIGGGAWRW